MSKIKISCLGVLVCLSMISCGGGNKKKEEVTKVERSMMEKPLLAGLPVNNRVMDPEYYLESGLTSWFFEKVSEEFALCESVSRVTFPDLPAGRHALLISGNAANPTGCIAWGSMILGVSAVKVNIWASYEQQTALEEFDIKISYFDPQQGDENVYQVLQINEASAQTIGGLTWYQFEGLIPASAQGWGDIQITHNTTSNLLVGGFTAQDVSQKHKQLLKESSKTKTRKLTHSMKRSLKNRERFINQ